VELTQDDAGSRRTVSVGEAVTVALAENPTTGYEWQPEVDAAALSQSDDQFHAPTSPRGAEGLRRLTFVPLRGGPTRLRLVKKRAWESASVAEFEVLLDVRE
jgi:predicted secreted protein